MTRRAQRWIYRVPGPIPALSPTAKTRIMLESLGPTYVKLGQIISSQASVLPDDWRVQLDLLQNEVPPVPYELARQVIIAELGAPPEELYASFSPRASRAAQKAPDYLKGLLSWRDQLKKGRLTIYLDTSAVDRQVDQLRGITAWWSSVS